MRRHSTDPVALLAGALFITVGAAYLGGALSDTKIEARWVLPTVLITLGLAGLLVSLVNLARQRRPAGLTTQPVGGGAAPADAGADTTATIPPAVEPEPVQPEPVQPEPVQPETVQPEPVRPEAVQSETLPLETPPQEATEQETAEPETVELETESPESGPPRTVPPERSPADTSPTETGIEPGDEPRDRP